MKTYIRPYDKNGDVTPVTRILNQWNVVPTSEERMERSEWLVPAGSHRIVAVSHDGQIIAFGPASPEGAGRFFTQIFVDRDYRRHGVGGDLYDELRRFIVANGGRLIQTQVRDDDPESLVWARRRGFRQNRHQFKSFLKLSAFDPGQWESSVANVEATGIQFRTLADLGVSEETLFKLYSLQSQVVRDIPGHNPHGPRRTFDEYCTRFHRARPPLECQLVALDGETFVGLAILEPGLRDGACLIENDLTGVDRRYRGRGIAQALKVLAARVALRYGATHLWTRNDSQNAPILAINRKMGYQPEPGTYSLIKDLAESPEASP